MSFTSSVHSVGGQGMAANLEIPAGSGPDALDHNSIMAVLGKL